MKISTTLNPEFAVNISLFSGTNCSLGKGEEQIVAKLNCTGYVTLL